MKLLNSLFILFFFSFGIIGCTTKPTPEPFYTRIFEGNYDAVWLAALKALNDYPLKVSNKDTGKIQSETVNGPYNDLFFSHPEGIELPERFRYNLKFNFAKLVADNKKPMIRVRIIKELEQFQDFYTGWVTFPSDGLEERLILYRIEHILGMEKTLAKNLESH